MEEEDDDLYGSNEQPSSVQLDQNGRPSAEGSEEGEEFEEDSDSDIDIIVERKAETRADSSAPPVKSEANRDIQVSQSENSEKPAKKESSSIQRATSTTARSDGKSGADYPAIHTSDVKFEDDPTYEPTGKPLTDLDFDKDLAEHSKPWRLPGTDQTEYFNYGFDEFTWATYCLKQKSRREEVQKEKSQMDMMFGMPGQGGPADANMGMPDMAQMQQFMQQMMAGGQAPQGMDPSMFAGNLPQMQGGGFGPGDGNMGPMDGGGAFRGRGRGRRW